MSIRTVVAGLVVVGVSVGCGQSPEQVLEGTRELSVAVCDPSGGPFSLDIDNPYLPYPEGAVWVLEGGGDKVQITVLPETEVVAGVTTRVLEEREWEGGELVEVSRNFVVQAPDGTVCYYGEDVDDYEDGEISGHGGAWRAGQGNASPGIVMPAKPEKGVTYKQEVAPGSAEDAGVIVGMGESVKVPAGAFTDTLSVLDVNPMKGEVDPKYYARGVGMIVDESLKLTEYTLP
jgi:hypothetical protein